MYAAHQPNPGDGRRIGHALLIPLDAYHHINGPAASLSHRRPIIESRHLREGTRREHAPPSEIPWDGRADRRRRATPRGRRAIPILASHHSAFAGCSFSEEYLVDMRRRSERECTG